MELTIAPGRLGGAIEAPPSKSALQRAIACATFARGTSILHAGELCADARAALGVGAALGASIAREAGTLRIDASSVDMASSMDPLELDCGESGLCMRMFTPLAALMNRPVTLRARGTLHERSVAMAEAPLRALGAGCSTSAGRPPVCVHGPLRGGHLKFDPGGSSQLLTGILMALPLAAEDSVVEVERPSSVGYLDLTLEICSLFGVEIGKSSDYRTFFIRGGQRYTSRELSIEGDWSAAAFLLVAGALAGGSGGILVRGLRPDSAQPDKAVLDALSRAGVGVTHSASGLKVLPSAPRGFEFDATDCPDLFPPLVVLAAAAQGQSRISGVHRLRGKESDRAASLRTILGKLGIETDIIRDALVIRGGTLKSCRVECFDDHRIAMAAAVAALVAEGSVTLSGAECVSKSWPGFFDSLESIRIG